MASTDDWDDVPEECPWMDLVEIDVDLMEDRNTLLLRGLIAGDIEIEHDDAGFRIVRLTDNGHIRARVTATANGLHPDSLDFGELITLHLFGPECPDEFRIAESDE